MRLPTTLRAIGGAEQARNCRMTGECKAKLGVVAADIAERQ
jgi:hypothetical protein